MSVFITSNDFNITPNINDVVVVGIDFHNFDFGKIIDQVEEKNGTTGYFVKVVYVKRLMLSGNLHIWNKHAKPYS